MTIIEEKTDEAIEERNSIMNSGWLESQLEQFFSCIHIMLQSEINRSTASQQIISDFYSKKYLGPAKEVEECETEINVDGSLEIIKEDECPRL